MMKAGLRLIGAAILTVAAACSSDEPEVINTEVIKSKVEIKMKVGDFLYENLDGTITVKGFDAADNQKWQKQYEYVGGEDNIIEISGGFHHYSIGLTKWGATDEQVITLTDLYKERADGPQPTTYILGGEITPRKIKFKTSSLETSLEGSTELVPYSRVEYQYNDQDRISKLIHHEYDAETETFHASRYFIFTYSNNLLSTIKGYQHEDDQLYITDTYEYFPNGNVSRITQNNTGAGTVSTVDFTYNTSSGKITAVYNNSNGQGFTYQFDYLLKNITSDKTTKGGQTCSEGSYDYDKNINPLKHQGYVDFLLTNLSVNNKTTEDVSYTACAFPELYAEAYQYEYNDQGYPTIVTVNYNAGKKGQIQYIYE